MGFNPIGAIVGAGTGWLMSGGNPLGAVVGGVGGSGLLAPGQSKSKGTTERKYHEFTVMVDGKPVRMIDPRVVTSETTQGAQQQAQDPLAALGNTIVGIGLMNKYGGLGSPSALTASGAGTGGQYVLSGADNRVFPFDFTS